MLNYEDEVLRAFARNSCPCKGDLFQQLQDDLEEGVFLEDGTDRAEAEGRSKKKCFVPYR